LYIISKKLNQDITISLQHVTLSIKREDLLHPFVSGNKFRKLKYNIIEAQKNKSNPLITFGGAFSNHIAATAFASYEAGIASIGIIRGEELEHKISENPTLQFAQKYGMKLVFVSRETYQNKTATAFTKALQEKYGDHYLLPEGGTNALAVKGCQEILTKNDVIFDYICCAVGTGGTISGIINAALNHQKILGFPALKGDFLKEYISRYAKSGNWDLITNYHFGGYGKVTPELIDFINTFYKQTKIPLDPIYTGKMVFGVMDLINNNYFPKDSKILLIHTGGLQGIQGMNLSLERKKMNKIVC
jgi:1-aminocyclopropane-1-carboxylate deaminase